jgi:AraC-like DNA-binding protein
VTLQGPTVSSSVLVTLPAYLSVRGLSAEQCVLDVGLDREVLRDPNLPISLNAVAHMFDNIAQKLGDQAFGVSYATAYPIGGSGLLGQLMMTSSTVREALAIVARYLQIHTAPMQATFTDDRTTGIGSFAFSWPASFTAPQLHYTAFGMGAVLLRIRLGAGATWCPLSSHFNHRQPSVLEPYLKLFGSRLKFDQPTNGFSVDAITLARPMPPSLVGLADTVRELSDQRLKASEPPENTASALHALLADRLTGAEPFSLEVVAAQMQQPVRALQWRLELEGTTYEQVLLLTRISLAEKLLRNTDHPLTQISNHLGFSELSAFTRWSQRHFRMAPSAYRLTLRDPKRPEPAAPGAGTSAALDDPP